MAPRGQPTAPRRRLLPGLVRLASFRADGLASFGGTPKDLLNSFAPLIAFPLVGGVLVAAGGDWREGLDDMLSALVALLTPCIVSEWLARRLRREPDWWRYAVAFNWCQWALPAVGLLLMIAGGILAGAGVPQRAVAIATLAALVVYGLSLNWFLARAALRLTGPVAAMFVVAVNLTTGVLILLPRLMTVMSDPGA